MTHTHTSSIYSRYQKIKNPTTLQLTLPGVVRTNDVKHTDRMLFNNKIPTWSRNENHVQINLPALHLQQLDQRGRCTIIRWKRLLLRVQQWPTSCGLKDAISSERAKGKKGLTYWSIATLYPPQFQAPCFKTSLLLNCFEMDDETPSMQFVFPL